MNACAWHATVKVSLVCRGIVAFWGLWEQSELWGGYV
jgi:hypothetical protein